MHRVVESKCPSCNHILDAVTHLKDPKLKPSPGDASVCIYCGSFIMYKEDMQLRLFTAEEIANLDDETRMELIRARKTIEMLERRGQKPVG